MRLVTNTYGTGPTGGVEMNVYQISQQLARRGHSVNLLYVSPGSLLPEYRTFCDHVTRVPQVDYGYPSGRRGRLRESLRIVPATLETARRRPDVIYSNRIYSCAWAIPASRLTGAPIVCHLHGHDIQPEARLARLEQQVARFVAVSQFVADGWISNGMDPTRIEVVHNGVDPDMYPPANPRQRAEARQTLGLPPDVPVALYYGRLDPDKGVDVLLRAWAAAGLPPEHARLLVVGSPMLDAGSDYTRLLRSLATPSVAFLPNRSDVLTPLHAADVTVLPSVVEESFGRTLIESMAAGIPAIGSRIGGIPEVLGPLEHLLFDPGDVDRLADILASTLTWRSDDPGLGPICAQRALDHFTLAATVTHLETVLNEVSEGAGRRLTRS